MVVRRLNFITLILILAGCSERDRNAEPVSGAQYGRRVFAECAACHPASPSASSRIGPNLWGVVGRPSGSRDDFAYSKAMRNAKIVWTAQTLDAYLESPRTYMPGNRMSFAGLADDQARAAVIEYLETLQPKQRPSEN